MANACHSPAAPDTDVQTRHGDPYVAFGVLLVLHPRPRAAQPYQPLLEQVGGVVRIAGQHVAVAQQRLRPRVHKTQAIVNAPNTVLWTTTVAVDERAFGTADHENGGMTMTHAPDTGQGWSVEDLLQRPDDGNRYEITHGSLLVTPSPSFRHVDANDRLGKLMDRRHPRGFARRSQASGWISVTCPTGSVTTYLTLSCCRPTYYDAKATG